MSYNEDFPVFVIFFEGLMSPGGFVCGGSSSSWEWEWALCRGEKSVFFADGAWAGDDGPWDGPGPVHAAGPFQGWSRTGLRRFWIVMLAIWVVSG